MEKTYVIRVLAKKDAKLNYKPAINLTRKVLAEQNPAEQDTKVILRFKWYRPSQDVFEAIYSSGVAGTKVGFKKYHSMAPNVEMKDVVSYKALYKGIMNVFVKIDDEYIEHGDELLAATDFVNLILTILSEVTKTNFIKLGFYNKHKDNSDYAHFMTHLLGSMCVGIAQWFGYNLVNLDHGHELITKLFVMNAAKIQGLTEENINETLFLIDDLLTYIESSSYFITEFTE